METDGTVKAGLPGRARLAALLGAALCLVFGLLLVCNLVIIIKGTLDPEKPPAVFGITPMVVLSGSMSGTQEGHIEAGDLIFVKTVDPDTLQVGDVVAYMSNQTAVTHRISTIETAEDGTRVFTTKGDANEVADAETVAADQLIGLYQSRIPKLGDFALFLQKPLGMLLFIGVPLFAFILYDVLRRQRYADRERKRAQAMEEELARLRALAGQEQGLPSQAEDARRV